MQRGKAGQPSLAGLLAEPAGLDPGVLLDAGGLAGEAAEVVQPGAAYLAPADDLDLLQPRRVDVERALNANAVRDAPAGEVGPRAAIVAANDDAFKDLRALAVAFDDLGADLDGVAGLESVQLGRGCEFDQVAYIHNGRQHIRRVRRGASEGRRHDPPRTAPGRAG